MSTGKKSHPLENEIKLPMRGPGPARRLLRKLDFRVIRRRHLERNELFDFVDGRLRKKGCVLRLRFTAGSCLLTFKGRPLGLRPHKVRREIEVETKEGRSLGQIFEMAGLNSVLRYEKYRTLYASQVRKRRRSSGVIALDETPVGTFLELEGSPLWIDRTARRLGFSREDYLAETYPTLYSRHFRRQGGKAGRKVFKGR